MKRLFPLLLALCIMCSVVSAGAELTSEDGVFLQSGTATAGCFSFEVPKGWVGAYVPSDGFDLVYIQSESGEDAITMTIEPAVRVDGQLVTADYVLSSMQLQHTGEIALHVEYDIIGSLAGGDFIRDVKGYTNLLLDESTGGVLLDANTGKAVTVLMSNIAWVSDELDVMIQIEQSTLHDVEQMVETGNEFVRSISYQGEKGTYDFIGWTEDNPAENQANDFSAWNIGGSGVGFCTPNMSATTEPAVKQCVIITGNSANIRKGANTEAPIITTALKGDTFTYLGESGNWYKIDVNGQIGYVSMGLSDIQ